MNKKLVIGILAHVDAGKTTLSESMLYQSGSIRKLGRVDKGDAFLDTYELERERGITIFSKQAQLSIDDLQITLLDTPGHVDFSAEMERTLQVLDYAILVISGADGVQGHTETLWKLLERYHIPVFLFINKMDQNGTDEAALMNELKKRLDENCVDFSQTDTDELNESIAMCSEALLEQYLESGEIEDTQIRNLIRKRNLFPCYFGSALKVTGVDEFMRGIMNYTEVATESEEAKFGAKVYKISRDDQGNRLTYIKVTSGCLKVKDLLSGRDRRKEKDWEEKINQIRIYSGAKFDTVNQAERGMICAVTGLSQTYPGEGLGIERDSDIPILEPVLTYQIQLPEDCDVHSMLEKLRQLEEEEPLLHIIWNEKLGEIYAQIMGEVQIEVLKSLIWERFHVRIEFGKGNIVYKETIRQPVEGVGHFEPLRHYAEVHLLLEPAEAGTGLHFFSNCSQDTLDLNWQRLILTHLEEKEHCGVLTGSAITDMHITLTTGKAHQKHTEGGDFRQATYRAVRQGLKKAESILLEPYYSYRLEVPADMVGRAMTDIQRMSGSFDTPLQDGEIAILTGSAPVVTMRDYQTEVISYTKGRGRLSCTLEGYKPCHNQEEVVKEVGYDSERDLDNPTGSVFCAHGAGFVVKWDEVENYMHLQSTLESKETVDEEFVFPTAAARRASTYLEMTEEDQKELDAMVEASQRKREAARKSYAYRKDFSNEKIAVNGSTKSYSNKKKQKEYLLVDGYNIIFAWEELNELAQVNMDAARGCLQDVLCNYQGIKKCELILVFDAYKVEGFSGEIQKYHNIHVVYTKEAETADQYIEKVAHEIGRKYLVTVATSDGTEQVIIRGQGCHLLSAKELKEEVEFANKELRQYYSEDTSLERNYLFQYLDKDTARQMEEVRLGINISEQKKKK
ncbi:TetM/TetW/TetO/TetS family tetracycline resistance ribosomal protection protein [Mediterraneibacter sp. NSJ-151]|uniref:translation factor GTPase family protein n=1 Tax=Mediterraneibacter sp. NSJ-151 TaxID=2897708 RepID=UPI001F0ACBFA|nr:TetM/TetW/TetO/TetS family tetracycline resistance ribosomal protection protein [Mediterraneibacter sp. NSJ-151]MCH4279252.1 TetM/TetW/TetO/TetS family tetracycline resistance ribosomal protection protein [Mediterraneibacter sp. NSJ-151]